MNQGHNRTRHDFFDSDSSDHDYNEMEDRFILPSEGHDKRIVLMSVIVPYSHTYLAVANSLPNLLYCMLPEVNFIRVCIEEITRKYDNAACKYGRFFIHFTMIDASEIYLPTKILYLFVWLRSQVKVFQLIQYAIV